MQFKPGEILVPGSRLGPLGPWGPRAGGTWSQLNRIGCLNTIDSFPSSLGEQFRLLTYCRVVSCLICNQQLSFPAIHQLYILVLTAYIVVMLLAFDGNRPFFPCKCPDFLVIFFALDCSIPSFDSNPQVLLVVSSVPCPDLRQPSSPARAVPDFT